jgi:putative transposase
MAAYAHWLYEYSQKFRVAIHAWVFMTNHVHLLVTPGIKSGVSEMMQSLGRRYVQYYNYSYKRSGTLWEGRYKSCAVQDEVYLLQCYRYIEMNPVRANMVNHPSDYRWSSYGVNAQGVTSKLCTPHDQYRALGANESERQAAYRDLFLGHLDDEAITRIRQTTNSGMALGNDRFKDEVELVAKRRVRLKKAGRPRLEEV